MNAPSAGHSGRGASAAGVGSAIGFLLAPAAYEVVRSRPMRLDAFDGALIDALHELDFEIAIETNGTIAAPEGIDWICVSPKAGAELVQRGGNELKLVYPQTGAMPEQFEALAFEHLLLQPMWGERTTENMRDASRYCMAHPRWRLSVQTHKWIGIP